MAAALDRSYRDLVEYLEAHPELDDIAVIRVDLAFATGEQAAQVLRIVQRFGMQPVETPPPATAMARLHLLGENALIGLFVLARNPSALRADVLRRTRLRAAMSRDELFRRFGQERSAGNAPVA